VISQGVLEEEELLAAHADAMRKRLKIALAKEQYHYLFRLNDMEAIAFRQTWHLASMELQLQPYPAELIRSSLAVVDKFIATQSVHKPGV
jgi:hypothetical protein